MTLKQYISHVRWIATNSPRKRKNSSETGSSSSQHTGTSLTTTPNSGESWTANSNEIVNGPFEYLRSTPGKDIRSVLIDAFNEWLQVPNERLHIIKETIGVLHTASLLIDDIQDNSPLRRGYPSSHLVFGIPQTINSANHAYFLALKLIQGLGNRSTDTIFTEEIINLHLGQGMDLHWRDSGTCPSQAEYLEIVNNKTGGLFRMAVRLMQTESACTRDYVPLAETLGKIFQIRDDYKNITGDEYAKNKGTFEDIAEGKFSFPAIHSIQADPQRKVLQGILKQRTDNTQLKALAVECIHSTGSIDYTRSVIEELVSEAETLSRRIDDGRGKLHGIERIINLLRV